MLTWDFSIIFFFLFHNTLFKYLIKAVVGCSFLFEFWLQNLFFLSMIALILLFVSSLFSIRVRFFFIPIPFAFPGLFPSTLLIFISFSSRRFTFMNAFRKCLIIHLKIFHAFYAMLPPFISFRFILWRHFSI